MQIASGPPSKLTVAMFRALIVTALKRADKILILHGETDGDKSKSISFEKTVRLQPIKKIVPYNPPLISVTLFTSPVLIK